MNHGCFISFKEEDTRLKNRLIRRLDEKGIPNKSVTEWIESNNLDYIMQTIRNKYMQGTTVTIFLIGEHSSENEGLDKDGRNKQAFIIRELQATLYDRSGNPRDGLLGVVLPSMEKKIFGEIRKDNVSGSTVQIIDISEKTVIKEFSENYWLKKNKNGHYDDDGQFAVLCRYCEFMNDPKHYIDAAYERVKKPIAKLVHFKDIKHKGM